MLVAGRAAARWRRRCVPWQQAHRGLGGAARAWRRRRHRVFRRRAADLRRRPARARASRAVLCARSPPRDPAPPAAIRRRLSTHSGHGARDLSHVHRRDHLRHRSRRPPLPSRAEHRRRAREAPRSGRAGVGHPALTRGCGNRPHESFPAPARPAHARPSAMKCALLLVLAAGCTGSGDGTAGGGAGSDPTGPDAGPTVLETIARAQLWVDAQVPYCQAANHQPDYDSACSSTCTRPDVPDWDPYRSDCSGFVSWAWKLPAPGRVTRTFAPFKTDITSVINAMDLAPGDAVNNSEHIMLFKARVTPGMTATFMEEPGCSSTEPYAREFTADVTIDATSISVLHHGTFTAIRYPDAPK